MEKYNYNTISTAITDALYKIKGSKFYGLAFPINNEAEVYKYLEQIKVLHPKASHYCYAYRIGINGETYRANDDDEPSGTAGIPIYNQLLSKDLTNVLVIIVRYFGGTKLGVGGLVKAYKESAIYTIEQTHIISKELSSIYQLTFHYDIQPQVNSIIKKVNAEIIQSNFTNNCQLKISIPLKEEKVYQEKIIDFVNRGFIIQKKE